MSLQLPPDPHLLLSFVKRGVSWPGVLSEFVDNAFDDAAGDSRDVLIELRKGQVTITDHGRGIEDMNRLGTLGASASFHHEGNIGQYGVGAKTWMCKATKLDVETIHNGRRHKHTFNLAPVLRSIERKESNVAWLTGYDGKGHQASEGSFTRITLRDFLPGAGTVITPALIAELQRSYWPGLRDGRSIIIRDYRSRPMKEITVNALAPPSWTECQTVESEVNGRRYRATIGILTDNVGAYSGLFLGFLFRNICVEKSLETRPVPPRIHGQIELSADWRHALSNYKDSLVEDRDALMADLERHFGPLLNLADEFAEDLRLDKIALELESVHALATLASEGRQHLVKPGGGRGTMGGGTTETPVEDGGKEKPERTDTAKPNEDDERSTASGLRIRWMRLGRDTLGQAEVFDRILTVTLNRDCPKLEAQSRQPRYPGLYLAIGNQLAMKCNELTFGEIESLFGPMLGAATGTENKARMQEAIRVWWGFVAEEDEESEDAA